MPALSGQVIQTLRNGTGAKVIEMTYFWTVGTGALRDGTFTTSTGSKTGALIVDNLLGRGVRVVVHDTAGNVLRTVTVPSAGAVVTTAQFAAQGVTNVSSLQGLTFDLA